MHVAIVHVHVKPGDIGAFIEATRANHEGAVEEPGNFRFDVLQDANDPARFVLYESYAGEAAAKAHKEMPHYLAWRDAVAGMMAEPRRGDLYNGLLPAATG